MGPGDRRLGACCGLALAASSAAPGRAPVMPGEQVRSDADAAATARPSPPPEPRAPSPWPELAALVPGVVVHGSGTWLQGRRVTTERLLLLEAAGVLAILAGGLVVYETGAARDVAGPATLLIAAGTGALSSSLLASLYATWAPRSGWAEPLGRLPRLVSALGYTFADDPAFADHHFLTTELEGRLGAWALAVDALVSPSPGRERLAARAGYRLFGAREGSARARDGSYLEPHIGLASERFDHYGFLTSSLELAVDGRLDAERLLPDVRGAFFQGTVGWSPQWTEFDVPGVNVTDASSLLLVHSGFGVYVGPGADPASGAARGELELYYDHRRDGLAGGMKTLGPSSGFAGHVGLRGEYFATESWGMRGRVELGSTWVLGSSIVFRAGLP